MILRTALVALLATAALPAWSARPLVSDDAAALDSNTCEIEGAGHRITRSGDVANKIGTYSLAVLAQAHGIPFFVAAPCSTLDLSLTDGAQIPIEERSADEVKILAGVRIAPAAVPARHPAFDVTPARLVTAIITDTGVARAPYDQSLPQLLAASSSSSLRNPAR